MAAAMKWAIILLSFLCICSAQKRVYEGILKKDLPYPLPKLNFLYDALEPHIDNDTMYVHHTGHHQAYTNAMNKVLQEWRREEPESELAHSSIVEILEHISEVPSHFQTQIRNHGGGYVNHIIYWAPLCPDLYSTLKPQGELGEDIEVAFGSMTEFLGRFWALSAQVFGSGYGWLVEDSEGNLILENTANQDSPLSSGHYPLLVIDMWEHAFYLQHQNRKMEYYRNWLSVICWNEVQELRKFWRKAGRIPQKNEKEKKTEL